MSSANDIMHDQFSALNRIKWSLTTPPDLPANIALWLLDKGSMTQRFKQHNDKIRVSVNSEQFVCFKTIDPTIAQYLPCSPNYWQREVTMLTPDAPWLIAQTLIPEQTYLAQNKILLQLGSMPLGHYLFSEANAVREIIAIGIVGELWGRRSRFCWNNHHQLLLSELFLPAAPLYQA